MKNIEAIKQLREKTGLSVSVCKKALEQAGNDLEKAEQLLRSQFSQMAEAKQARIASQGIVEAYLHPNRKVGAMVLLLCESDFVARSEDFHNLAHELCLQVAAMNPRFVSVEEAELDPAGELEVENKAEACLLSQAWIKDQGRVVKELIDEFTAKAGEKVVVKKFVRFEV